MARSRWGRSARRAGCRLLLVGTVALPTLLGLAAFWRPGLYLLPIPVVALIAAVCFLAAGLGRRRSSPPTDGASMRIGLIAMSGVRVRTAVSWPRSG